MLRTFEITAITPNELADEFCQKFSSDQAEFFSRIWMIAKTWPGSGWCGQAASIIECADNDAIQAIRTLASHLPKEDVEWIVAASGGN